MEEHIILSWSTPFLEVCAPEHTWITSWITYQKWYISNELDALYNFRSGSTTWIYRNHGGAHHFVLEHTFFSVCAPEHTWITSWITYQKWYIWNEFDALYIFCSGSTTWICLNHGGAHHFVLEHTFFRGRCSGAHLDHLWITYQKWYISNELDALYIFCSGSTTWNCLNHGGAHHFVFF
jgi:hypothetical protein